MEEMIASARDMIRFGEWATAEEMFSEEENAGKEAPRRKRGAHAMNKETFLRRYGILLIGAAAFTIYTLLLIAGVQYRTEKRVRAEMAEYYQQQLADYHEQRQQEQAAEYFLSGEASREAFINQEIDTVAPVIAKLSTDAQKATETSCMLARVMNPSYPNSFQEVAEQPQQWPLYDGKDKTYSQHDRDIAESILRPYLESGMIPSGLTQDMVYASWSQNDLVLRDRWEASSTMNTWRYQG
jgi:hypothetical protein